MRAKSSFVYKKNKNIRRGYRRGHPSKIDKYAEKNKHGVWIIRPRWEVDKIIAIHFFKNEVKVLIKWKNSKKRTYEPFDKIIEDIPLLFKKYYNEKMEC